MKNDRFPERDSDIDQLIPGWSGLLKQWRAIVAHEAWANTEDCSWWYGERASVSQLAGAAWKKGWAIQEYAGTRGAEGRARIDLAVEVPAYGLRSVVEAKQIWPWLGSSHAFEDIEQGLQEATEQLIGGGDTSIARHDEYDHVAVVFVTPRARSATGADEIQSLIDTLCSVPRTVACWSFPDWASSLTSPTTQLVYPGIGLVARLVRRAAVQRARSRNGRK
jgi:hypothetical protein